MHHCPSKNEEFPNSTIDLLPLLRFLYGCVTSFPLWSIFSFISSLLPFMCFYVSSLDIFCNSKVSLFFVLFFFFPCYLILKMTIILAKSCVILLPNQIFYNCLQYVSSKTSSAYAFFTKVLWTAHK